SASLRSPASMKRTNVGTSTDERSPAASNSKRMFETRLDVWYVLPRNVVPSAAPTAITRTKPVMRETTLPAVIDAVDRRRPASRSVAESSVAGLRDAVTGQGAPGVSGSRRWAPGPTPYCVAGCLPASRTANTVAACPMNDSRLSTVDTWAAVSGRLRMRPTKTPRPPGVSWPASAATMGVPFNASWVTNGIVMVSSSSRAPAPDTITERVPGNGIVPGPGGVVVDADVEVGEGGAW